MAGGEAPLELLGHEFVVVDVETTGLSPYHDSIIEIGAAHLTNGEITATFHSLVDPGVPLPQFVSTLTGVGDDDLRGQPRLGDVADAFLEFLGDRIFVAHNANFDYNFIRQGLRRYDRQYRATTLCTMLLSRQLYPRNRRAGLDAMLAHCGISVPSDAGARHRAMYDVRATALLFCHLARVAQQQGTASLGQLRAAQREPPWSRKNGDTALARDLPSTPGVYLMRDANGQILYIGKAKDLRKRVQSHLRPADPSQPKLKRTLPQVAAIDVVQTGSELEALLLESRLIKRYLPTANIALRDYERYPFIRLDLNEPFPRPSLTRYPKPDGAAYYGPFNRAGPVHTVVELVHDVFKLARCSADIVPGVTPPCLYGQIGRCSMPCTGAVSQETYRAQVAEAARFLDGSDRSVIAELERRRDALAEELRFEEAAELRDRIAELDHVFGSQQRLHFAVSEHNLVVVAPSTDPRAVELFCIRAGRLGGREKLVVEGAQPAQIERLIRATYDGLGPATAGLDVIGKEEVDELHIISAWLKHNTERHRRVPVAIPLADPPALAESVLAAARDLLSDASQRSAEAPAAGRGARR